MKLYPHKQEPFDMTLRHASIDIRLQRALVQDALAYGMADKPTGWRKWLDGALLAVAGLMFLALMAAVFLIHTPVIAGY